MPQFVLNSRFVGFSLAVCLSSETVAVDAPSCPDGFADTPGIPVHMEQSDTIDGTLSFSEVRQHGKAIFEAVYNVCDGVGRPATTGCLEEREPDEPLFHRLSGADANSCAGCHNQPRSGGAGDIVMNQFFLADCLDPVATSADPQFQNFRNTPGMFGSGLIEMLGHEMTADVKAALAGTLPDGWNTVTTKGVDFEFLIEAGEVVGAVGIDVDDQNIEVSPFEVTGRINRIRTFTFNSFNANHGMQAEEFFNGRSIDTELDEDKDGLERELTTGDITAVTIFQAAMGVPTQVLPTDPAGLRRVTSGQSLFNSIGCAECHIPALTLDSAVFNDGVSPPFDLTNTGELPRAESNGSGGVIVRAYTDLKMHNLCDHEDHPDPIRTYCNEQVEDVRRDRYDATHTLRPAKEFFITRKLWDAGSSAPYGHSGELVTLFEAIVAHAGEAREARNNYVALTRTQQENVVLFLKSLQVPSAEGDVVENGVVVSGTTN